MAHDTSFRRVTISGIEQHQYVDEDHVTPYVYLRRIHDNPDVVEVTFPPGARLAKHSHPSDTLYVFKTGEFNIEGEGSFCPGEIRWVQGGFSYGPEEAGPEGAVVLIIATNGPFGTDWSR